jgi:hypothetical protein
MGIIECGGKHTYSDHEKFVMRRDAAASVARQERTRLNQILNHPSVKSGRLYKLGCFLALETDMGADEACATLDKAHQGNETVHRASGSYETDVHPIERDRREKQALNDLGYEAEVAKRGGRAQDSRTPRQRQMDDDFANIARGASRKDDESDDDNNKLKALGFGGGAQFEQSAYSQGAAAASHLLGKSSLHIAPRGGDTPYAREAMRPATPTAPAGDAYSAGAESAKRLLFGSSAVRAEADNELRQRYADQQRERAQQN